MTNPAQLPEVLHRAMRTAILQQGVAVVVIPGDIALMEVDKHLSAAWPVLRAPRLLPAAEDVQQLAEILQQSKAVTLLCGSGCAGAHDAVVALADTLGAPIVHALRGKEHVEWSNPFDVGMTGLIGFSSGYHAMLNCDTLIMLGTDFPYRQFYPKDATIVQVDRDPAALGRRTPLQLGIAADVGETIAALLPQLERREERGFLDKSLAHYRKAREGLDELAVPADEGEPLHPQFVTRLISQIADEDAVFTCDVGTPTVWAARYLRMNGQRRLLGSFNHGSMANAMPQALGVQAACPGRQVISLSGDGGFAMLMGDFISLAQLNLPVKVVVFNNASLGFVAMEMKAAGYLDTGTGCAIRISLR